MSRRRADRDRQGFWLSFFLNLCFQYELPAIAVFLGILRLITGWQPLVWFMIAALGIWVVYGFAVTMLLSAASNLGDTSEQESSMRYRQAQRAEEIRRQYLEDDKDTRM